MVKVTDGQCAHFSSIVYSGDAPSGRTAGFFQFDEHSNEETGLGVRVYITFDPQNDPNGPEEAASVFTWRGTDTSCGFQMAKSQMKCAQLCLTCDVANGYCTAGCNRFPVRVAIMQVQQ